MISNTLFSYGVGNVGSPAYLFNPQADIERQIDGIVEMIDKDLAAKKRNGKNKLQGKSRKIHRLLRKQAVRLK